VRKRHTASGGLLIGRGWMALCHPLPSSPFLSRSRHSTPFSPPPSPLPPPAPHTEPAAPCSGQTGPRRAPSGRCCRGSYGGQREAQCASDRVRGVIEKEGRFLLLGWLSVALCAPPCPPSLPALCLPLSSARPSTHRCVSCVNWSKEPSGMLQMPLSLWKEGGGGGALVSLSLSLFLSSHARFS
jgi:hypothetical protein